MTKSRIKKPSKSVCKPGGQKNNKNALRHGFYAKSFTPSENIRLDSISVNGIESEIALIRVCIDKLKDQISFDEIIHNDKDGNETRDNHYIQQLNTLSLMTQSICTLTRTHYLIRGKFGDIQDSILRALEELRLEMGL